MTPTGPERSRRRMRQEKRQIESEFRRLARDGIPERFRAFIIARGIVEGSKEWDLAWESWREMRNRY